tara:strand:- start:126 stop:740 length:615 start_codon:yes stop_codon:yes gene_type:complete
MYIILLLCAILYWNKYAAKILLHVVGWKPLPEYMKYLLRKHDKLVMIYPHTSYWDSIWMLVYRIAYPDVLSDLVFLIRPDFLDIPLLGSFLKAMGGVGASSIKTKNGGRTQDIVNSLNDKKRFHLAISPKGTIKKRDWRSGYYYIAKGTDALVTAVGYDYVKGIVEIYSPQNENTKLLEKNELEIWLQYRMRPLIQRNPDNVEY